MITVRAAAATDTGRVRAHNEDSVYAGVAVFTVADGMGGHAAGDVASALAVRRLRGLDELPWFDAQTLRDYVGQANQDILDEADRDTGRAGMGTTVAGLLLAGPPGGQYWLIFNAGDCRVYRYQPHGRLDQLTVDHTEVAELVAQGSITEQEARTHPRRNIVTRALGTDPATEPDVWALPAEAGERFLVCSDGLPLEVGDDRIEAVLAGAPGAAQAASTLIGLAVDAGGRDNVTVIVLDTYDDGGWRGEDASWSAQDDGWGSDSGSWNSQDGATEVLEFPPDAFL